MTEPPAQTFAHMLRALLELPANVIVASEWKRASNARIRKLIRSKRRHFHNSKTSLANYLHDSAPSERHLLVDDADESLVNELGLSLRELEVNGNYFGEWSMTIILYDLDQTAVDRSVAECVKVFATQDADCYRRTLQPAERLAGSPARKSSVQPATVVSAEHEQC